MAKFISFYQSNYSATPQKIGEDSTIEAAAKRCDDYCSGDRNHACIKAIIERRYYGIGFGASQLFVEEH